MENVRIAGEIFEFRRKGIERPARGGGFIILSFSLLLLLLLLSLGKLSGKGRYYLFYLIIFLENSLSSREE